MHDDQEIQNAAIEKTPRFTPPRTARDALMLEVLGDLDGIIKEIDKFPEMMKTVEGSYLATVKTLTEASDQYKDAIVKFSEAAKRDLENHIKTIRANTVEEEKAALQEAARLAFRSEASDKAADLARILTNLVSDLRQKRLTRFAENMIIATGSAILAICLFSIVSK